MQWWEWGSEQEHEAQEKSTPRKFAKGQEGVDQVGLVDSPP